MPRRTRLLDVKSTEASVDLFQATVKLNPRNCQGYCLYCTLERKDGDGEITRLDVRKLVKLEFKKVNIKSI